MDLFRKSSKEPPVEKKRSGHIVTEVSLLQKGGEWQGDVKETSRLFLVPVDGTNGFRRRIENETGVRLEVDRFTGGIGFPTALKRIAARRGNTIGLLSITQGKPEKAAKEVPVEIHVQKSPQDIQAEGRRGDEVVVPIKLYNTGEREYLVSTRAIPIAAIIDGTNKKASSVQEVQADFVGGGDFNTVLIVEFREDSEGVIVKSLKTSQALAEVIRARRGSLYLRDFTAENKAEAVELKGEPRVIANIFKLGIGKSGQNPAVLIKDVISGLSSDGVIVSIQ